MSETAVPRLYPRRHDIDVLRVGAFLLLILYHVAMAYVAEWGWHVKSSYQSELLQWPMLLLNRWRMPLLFLLSGLAIGLYRPQGRAWPFARERSLRLLLPLLFGMLAIVPIQAYCQGVSNGLVAPGFGRFLIDYLSFQPWPEQAFDGAKEGITWNHLWYLPYLWVYTMLLLALLPLLQSRFGQAMQRWIDHRSPAQLVLLLALPATLSMQLLADRWPARNNLVEDWYQHALYFGIFLSGFLLGCSAGLWPRLAAARKALLAGAVLSGCLYFPLLAWIDGQTPSTWLLLGVRTLRMLYMACVLLGLLAWAHHALNRPFRWLRYANEAVYPWYILHQSLTVWLVYLLAPLHLGAALEPTLVVVGTVLGCALAHELLIRRNRWLRPLFGLKPSPVLPVTAPAASRIGTSQTA